MPNRSNLNSHRPSMGRWHQRQLGHLHPASNTPHARVFPVRPAADRHYLIKAGRNVEVGQGTAAGAHIAELLLQLHDTHSNGAHQTLGPPNQTTVATLHSPRGPLACHRCSAGTPAQHRCCRQPRSNVRICHNIGQYSHRNSSCQSRNTIPLSDAISAQNLFLFVLLFLHINHR